MWGGIAVGFAVCDIIFPVGVGNENRRRLSYNLASFKACPACHDVER